MADLKLIKPLGVQNTINKFCLTIGMIPSSYKLSLTYEEQILSIGKYLEETVIPALNNNAEAVAELQTLFVQLKDYVENYFTDLNIQNEINNKLDEMAQDGSLENIINNEIFGDIQEELQNINRNINTTNENLNTTNENLNTTNESVNSLENFNEIISNIKRSKNYNTYKHLIKPIFNKAYSQYSITWNGEKWVGEIDEREKERLKNQSTNIWYISNTGNNENDGKTPQTPKQDLGRLLLTEEFIAGDTIICLPGIYERSTLNAVLSKSCNIIAEKPHTVFFTNSWRLIANTINFTENETYADVWETEQTNFKNITGVIDLQSRDYPLAIKKVNSLQECANTQNTYFISGNILHIHMLNNRQAHRDILCINYPWNYASIYTAENLENPLKIYCENIDIIGGSNSGFRVNKSTGETKHTVNCVNCRFMFTQAGGGFQNYGSASNLIDCEASYNIGDGIDYHEYAVGSELRCVGKYNGTKGNYNNNGSSAHQSNIIRINGVYHNNVGPNIADVIADVNSLNIGCVAFDSEYEGEMLVNGADFEIQDGNMYLIGCVSKGSKSIVNFEKYSGNMYKDNTCEFDTTDGEIYNINNSFVDSSAIL